MTIDCQIEEYLKKCEKGEIPCLSREDNQLEVCKMVLKEIAEKKNHYSLLAETTLHIIDNWEKHMGMKKFKVVIKIKGNKEEEFELWSTDTEAATIAAKESMLYFKEYSVQVFEV